jgi:PAS domain S-box-containing protein
MRSLRSTMVLGIALGILLPAFILGPLLARESHQRELDLRVRGLLTQYASMLEQAMSTPLWNVDPAAAKPFVESVMLNPDVVGISVEDALLGQFVLSKRPPPAGGTILRESRPVVREGSTIGRITIEMSTGQVEQQFLASTLKGAAALLVQLGISFFALLLLFERRMMQPLRQLQADADRLARGELTTPVLVMRPDELGDLAQGLDHMREELGMLITQREVQNESLQRELLERLRAEEAMQVSQAKFAAIFQASPIALSVSLRRDDYKVIDVNEAWTRQFGREREVVLNHRGSDFGLWKNPQDRYAVTEAMERHGELHDFEAWCKTGNGDDILCRISGRLIELGEDSVAILVNENITEERRDEERIRELNASLEQRVTERTQALNAANQELVTAMNTLRGAQDEIQRSERMAALGSLVAGVAHELNTPIGTCVTIASTLHDLNRDFASEMTRGLKRSVLEAYVSNSREATDILMRNLRGAAELIGSFKQVAVDRTSAKRRVFSLEAMVTETVTTMGPDLKRTPHEVRYKIDPSVTLDSYPGPLGQVLSNLINNAILHGLEGKAHGLVMVTAEPVGSAMVELTVSDDGVGIAPANLKRIFDPFFTTKLGQGGSGLGLNIVYNLVTDVLGGTIRVESDLGQGTRIILTLPLNAPASVDEAPLSTF